MKAELRICTTAKGIILLSETTTGGTNKNYAKEELNKLEKLMLEYYNNIGLNKLSDHYANNCVSISS